MIVSGSKVGPAGSDPPDLKHEKEPPFVTVRRFLVQGLSAAELQPCPLRLGRAPYSASRMTQSPKK